MANFTTNVRNLAGVFSKLRSRLDEHTSEIGDTLVELLIALVVISVTAVALLAGFTTAITGSAEHRNIATLDTVLKGFIEQATHQLQGTTGSPTFTQCAQTSTYTTDSMGNPYPSMNLSETLNGVTYTAGLTGNIEYWQGSGFQAPPVPCPTTGTPPQQLLQATATNTANHVSVTLPFVVTDPVFAPAVQMAPTAFSTAASDAITVGSTSTFSVAANGFPTPTLTASSLPPWAAFVDNGGGTGTFFFNPPASAARTSAYGISLTATNKLGSSPPQSFQLTVSTAPAITSVSNGTVAPLTTQSFTVTTTGTPTPTLSALGLPTGTSFTDNHDGTGTLTVTPTTPLGVYTGTTGITLSAGSLGGTAVQNFSLVVGGIPPLAPVFTSSSSVTLTPNVPMAPFVVAAYGAPQPTITLTAGSVLPSGLSPTSGQGQLLVQGTPSPSPGTSTISFTATSGTLTQTFTVQFTVNPVSAPSISSTNPTPATATLGTSFSFSVFGTAFQNNAVVQSSGMSSVQVFFVNSNELEIAGTAGGSSGNYSFKITNPDHGSVTSAGSAFQVS